MGDVLNLNTFHFMWDSGNCLPRGEVNADGGMDTWKHGEMDGGVQMDGMRDRFREGRKSSMEGGEDGWIGGEHLRAKEWRKGWM